MKIIDVDLYMQRVLAFDCYEDFETYCKENNVVEDEDDEMMRHGSSGLAGVIEYEEPIESDHGQLDADLFIALREKRLDDLAHETLHCSWMILENAGVKNDFDNQEPLAYLSQYLFREYCKKFKWKFQY